MQLFRLFFLISLYTCYKMPVDGRVFKTNVYYGINVIVFHLIS